MEKKLKLTKGYQALFFLTLILFSCNKLYSQWLPSGTLENINANPIYVHGTATSGIYVGFGAGSGTYSTAVGPQVVGSYPFPLANSTGAHNVAIGAAALSANTSGTQNTSIGYTSMLNNTSGNYNTVGGCAALRDNTTGTHNTAWGYASLLANTSGIGNVAVGYGAGQFVTGISNYNVAIGQNSLASFATGKYNVAIGAASSVPNGDYQLSIQNAIYGRDMQSGITHGQVSIGSAPAAIAAGSIMTGANVFARLRLYGNNQGLASSASIPSLQLDYVPVNGGATPTPNPTGMYLFVDASGVVAQAPLPASGGGIINLYTSDGAIVKSSTTGINRNVDMNDRNIWFNTTNSPENGRIYIGSDPLYPTSTGDYRLYVEGGILSEKVKVAVRNPATNWADYVFADDYKLMSVKKIEEFIKANKHLPGIESADDLVKNGLDLGAMQAKQMSKIEELTLYIIDQDKKLEAQNEEIGMLKKQVKILLEKSK